MSLDTRLRDHLRQTGGDLRQRPPDLDQVIARGRRRRSVKAGVAGVASVIAVAGTVLLLQLTPDLPPVVTQVPAQTTIGTPPTPTTAPDPTTGADSGTIQTSLGSISWRHLTGDQTSLPVPNGGLVETPSGLAAVDWRTDDNGRITDIVYWRSGDGEEWTSSALPIEVSPAFAQLKEAAGSFWLTTDVPWTAWRSVDGESWTQVILPSGPGVADVLEADGTAFAFSSDALRAFRLEGDDWVEIDTSGFQLPDIEGVAWTLRPSTPASIGDTTVIPWKVVATVPWTSIVDIESNPTPYGVWDPETSTMEIWGDYGEGNQATLNVEVDGERIIFSDTTGAPIHEVVVNDPTLDPAVVLDLLGQGISANSIAVIDGSGGATFVESPLGNDLPFLQPIVVAGDEFTLISHDESLPAFGSSDGLVWTELPAPAFLDGAPLDGWDVRSIGNALIAETHRNTDVSTQFEYWVTTDGRTWTNTGVTGEAARFDRLGSAGIYFQDWVHLTPPYFTMGVSSDFRTWEQPEIGKLQISGPEGAGTYGTVATDNGVIHYVLDDGAVDLWIMTID